MIEGLLWAFHNARRGLCFPSHEKIAEAAGCARSTVAEAIRALEDTGVLSWVQRIKREDRAFVGGPVNRGFSRLSYPRFSGRRQSRRAQKRDKGAEQLLPGVPAVAGVCRADDARRPKALARGPGRSQSPRPHPPTMVLRARR
jgi:hypothetical protein